MITECSTAPKISVIMSVFDAMPFLPDAVESILKQKVKDFEFIIVNDCSTDKSWHYLEKIQDSRVKLVNLAENVGQGAARNIALEMCGSEFIAIMDADDISLPTRFESQMRFLNQHPMTGLVGTQFSYIGVRDRRRFSAPIPLDHNSIYTDLLRGRHGLVHASMMCRSTIMKSVGGYRVDRCGEDYDMLLRIGEVTRLANLEETLYLYRTHDRSSNVLQLAEMRMRFAHAAECAKRRAITATEPTFEEFVEIQNAQPIWNRWADKASVYALGNYKRALTEILGDRPFKGYMRLGLAALVSPSWTWQRLSREIRKRWRWQGGSSAS